MGWVTTQTRKGQVTIPKAVRDELGLKPADRIEIFVENGEAKLRKAFPSLDELVGIFPPLGMSVEAAIDEAKEERAERFAAKLARS